MLSNFKLKQPRLSLIFTDSQIARLAVLNKNNPAQTHHIDVKFKWIINQTEQGYFKLIQVRTDEMCADGMTKPLLATTHDRFLVQLRMKPVA